MKTIYAITGQTATGKTAYALDLASKLNGELINFDSRQIYKHLDIVTGKDIIGSKFHKVSEVGEKTIGYYDVQHKDKSVKLWLYDIVEPSVFFSSYDFEQLAIDIIKRILIEGKTPIFVGGTYLYLFFLLYGNSIQAEPDWELRKRLEKTSVENLQKLAKEKTGDTFEKLNESDRMNPHRLIRLLEKDSHIGEFKHELRIAEKLDLDKNELEINLLGFRYSNRENLRSVLRKRVEKRLDEGAVAEVEKLLHNGHSLTEPGMQSIGYKQITYFIKKDISYSEMVEDWISKEYQYAKRQLTFMKKNPSIKWTDI